MLKKQLLTLGIIGFILAPVKFTAKTTKAVAMSPLCLTRVVSNEVYWKSLELEAKLHGKRLI